MHSTVDLRTKGLRDVWVRVGTGHAVAIKVQTKNGIFVRGQVVVNQRSVQRTARRDHTPPFFSLQTFWAATDELYRL